jgi:uncharacterized protein DUF262
VDPFKTEKAVYTPTDFVLWQANGMLDLTPKFQRRAVWGKPAKSYFVDTLLRGMTVPPLYLRITQSKEKTHIVRQVVDGQQRIRSVLEFIHPDDGFRLSKTLKAPWANKRFSQLTEEQRQKIMAFGFTSEIFQGISDQQILEVFCRLNMNGLQLNKQELRNGKFFGYFKQAAYELAIQYLEFWRSHKLFNEQQIARMYEVELTSELLIAGSVGMQDKKNSIDTYYEKWEEDYPDAKRDAKRFAETMEVISSTFDGDLAENEFRRPPLFYSLYCAVYHHMYGLPEIQRTTPKKKLTADERESLREAARKLSEVIALARDPLAEVPKRYVEFVAATQRKTDNLHTRRTRLLTLFDEAF